MISLNRFSHCRQPKIGEYIILAKNHTYKYVKEEVSFQAFLKKNPSVHAVMYCTPEVVYRKDLGWVNSLYVSYLDTLGNCNKGLGTVLLNIASIYSNRLGFGGRFHLDASGLQSPNRVPHIFYRKFGMNTGFECTDKEMDKFVKSGKPATYLDFKSMTMFYPPIKYPNENKISLLQSLKEHILACLNWKKR
ncbi:MAG: hypothetical protein NC191_00830 [Muribaculaceae bacterium]|nr:hypothetical protein [Muribaculaceae bacterium]